ncbi:MAG: CRISPR-associated endonuclease Cas3'', partial [Tabrizicola sp.]
MLDVAAVAERLIAPFGIEPRLRDAFVLLVALHDLGKISDSFRAMIQDGASPGYRHWKLSEALFYAHDALLAARIGGDWWQRKLLYAAVAGHHGQPSDLALGKPAEPSRDQRTALAQIGSGLEPAGEVIAAFCDLWPEAALDSLD